MSIYSDLKELYKDTNDIVNGKNIAWKIIYMLQTQTSHRKNGLAP